MTEKSLLKNIPSCTNPYIILALIHGNQINAKHLIAIKELTGLSDKAVSKWLFISTKTYRLYKASPLEVKPRVKERVIFLLSLIKHGRSVFGTAKAFLEWLSRENFFFDKKKPMEFTDTYGGLKFIDDRLYAIEYGGG